MNVMYEKCDLNVYAFPFFTLGNFRENFLFVQTHFFVELSRPLSITLSTNELQSSEIIVNC